MRRLPVVDSAASGGTLALAPLSFSHYDALIRLTLFRVPLFTTCLFILTHDALSTFIVYAVVGCKAQASSARSSRSGQWRKAGPYSILMLAQTCLLGHFAIAGQW